ncbi:MAG: glycosyltransferase [Gammaproteobacteria bacterium]|nr:glycosyltransferase [Gammaproteobacteria bacterium]
MNQSLDVSIIIVSFNTREILRNCLRSIIDGTFKIRYEIIVVDNNSADESAQMVADCYPEVILLRSSLNLGFAKANNYALRTARAD